MKISFVLLVLRCQDIEIVKRFYECFGLIFKQEKHGHGPVHFSSVLSECVFEIYPIIEKQSPSNNRLGFRVEYPEKVLQELTRKGFQIKPSRMSTDFGEITVIKDPDGRYVEIYKEE